MHAVADVLTELTDLRVLPELPELAVDWSGLVSEWLTADPETEEQQEEETVTEPVEDYSNRSRGC